MRKLFNILTLFVVLLVVQATAFAQSQPTFTTLSAAIGDSVAKVIKVTSATGFVASTGQIDYGIFIDHEFMRITAVSGTNITVQRAQANTAATPHKNAATVFVGQYGSQAAPGVTAGPFVQTSYLGACTASNYPILPLIQVNGGAPRLQQVMYNCLGGQWYAQSLPDDVPKSPIIGACNIPIGSVAYASVGTNTTDIANKRMTTSWFVPQTQILTGIQVLQGGTATTDTISMYVSDSTGTPVVAGAAAGVALSGANTFLPLPFALNGYNGGAQTKTIITGPANYFVSIIGNGTAAGAYQTVPTATFKNIFSQGTTSITLGTYPSFTVPSTFTADLAPVICGYN